MPKPVQFDSKKVKNVKLVENGFANIYYPSKKDNYYPKLYSAWEKCLKNNVNLCEESLDACSGCIEVVDLNVADQFVELKNTCSFSCELDDWTIKDEGRKKFVFDSTTLDSGESITITTSDFDEEYVWTASGDTLFLRDNEGRLVAWEGY